MSIANSYSAEITHTEVLQENEIKKMLIVIIEFGGEDGVSLEAIKIIHSCLRLNIEPMILTGLYEGEYFDRKNKLVEISGEKITDPKIKIKVIENSLITPRLGIPMEIYDKGFEEEGRPDKVSESEQNRMTKQFMFVRSEIKKTIIDIVIKYGIQILNSQNANSIPMHPALGVAIKDVLESENILGIFHNHDFAWEREQKYLGTPYRILKWAIEYAFPGRTNKAFHWTINDMNKKILENDFNLKVDVMPNIMNFDDTSFGQIDDYNKNMLNDLGIPNGSILLGQVTRLVARKNIEASIEILYQVTKRRGDKKVVLIITGEESIGDKINYKEKLVEMIKAKGLQGQVYWVSDKVKPGRGFENSKKIYSLSDMYAMLAKYGMMTYPSTKEGFGNAFVEAVLAKVLIIVNNYPVYMQAIGKYGFENVLMQNGEVTQEVIDGVIKFITLIERSNNKKLSIFDRETARKKIAAIIENNFTNLASLKADLSDYYTKSSYNYLLGAKHLSYDVSTNILLNSIKKTIEIGKQFDRHFTFSEISQSQNKNSISKGCTNILNHLYI